jgi:hypothetical protein
VLVGVGEGGGESECDEQGEDNAAHGSGLIYAYEPV